MSRPELSHLLQWLLPSSQPAQRGAEAPAQPSTASSALPADTQMAFLGHLRDSFAPLPQGRCVKTSACLCVCARAGVRGAAAVENQISPLRVSRSFLELQALGEAVFLPLTAISGIPLLRDTGNEETLWKTRAELAN